MNSQSTDSSETNFFFKTAYKCKWMMLFHHLLDKGMFEKESLLYSMEPGKYSILGMLNDSLKIDGQFKFLLEYPDRSCNSGMNRWTQDNNPVYEDERDHGQAVVFTPKALSWSNAVSRAGDHYPFTGLALSSSGFSLLDGNSNSNFFFSIGQYQVYYTDYFPGFSDFNTEVILWVRIKENFIYMSNGNPKFIISILSMLLNMIN